MPLPLIRPPVLNSASPWATTLEDLQALFDCPYTGAITTRTSLLGGFPHNDSIHQYTFFKSDHQSSIKSEGDHERYAGSLNTLGYSPTTLSRYLEYITEVIRRSTLPAETIAKKCCIVSVTGSAQDIVQCYELICQAQLSLSTQLCMEINLSCPNIPDKPPPAYSAESLSEYLEILAAARSKATVAIGLKTPPYTYHGQFVTLIDALLSVGSECPVDFLTATNTLGSSLVLAEGGLPAINSASGAGIGGMAGAPLHALSLGNVKILRTMLDEHAALRAVDIIGVGGVSDTAGLERMLGVGAKAAAIATALGQQGVQIFQQIVTESKYDLL